MGFFGLCNSACMWRGMACFLVYLSKKRELEDKAAPVYPCSQYYFLDFKTTVCTMQPPDRARRVCQCLISLLSSSRVFDEVQSTRKITMKCFHPFLPANPLPWDCVNLQREIPSLPSLWFCYFFF